MANDAYASARITAMREEKGKSEMDMATAMGIPLTLYRVFAETPSKFDESMLKQAAGILGCDVDDLVGNAADEEPLTNY